MRACKECGDCKPVEEFPLGNKIKGKTYYRHICGKCYCKAKHSRRMDIREEYISIKKSLKCLDCGNDDFRVLEFDHRGEKEFNLGDALSRGYSIGKIKKEIAKCDVRCANCHRIQTWLRQNIGV